MDHGGLIVNGPTEPPLQGLTIAKLLEQQLARHPEKPAVVSKWQKTSLTYKSLFDSCRDIAQALILHGVRPSDRVVALAGNSIEYVQLFFAAGAVGSVFTIINPTFTAEEAVSTVDFIGRLLPLWQCTVALHDFNSANSDTAQLRRQFSSPTGLGIEITRTF